MGWAVIGNQLAHLAAHYAYHGTLSPIALFQLGPGIGLIVGVHVAHRFVLRTSADNREVLECEVLEAEDAE